MGREQPRVGAGGREHVSLPREFGAKEPDDRRAEVPPRTHHRAKQNRTWAPRTLDGWTLGQSHNTAYGCFFRTFPGPACTGTPTAFIFTSSSRTNQLQISLHRPSFDPLFALEHHNHPSSSLPLVSTCTISTCRYQLFITPVLTRICTRVLPGSR